MAVQALEQPVDNARIAMERHSQWLVTAFIVSGMLFMLLPGTIFGAWNLIGISRQHMAGSLSPAWLQAHGHVQVFGWIGSFILGIGFYSLTKMQSTLAFPVRAGWAAWSLWTVGVLLRWTSGVSAWHWRILLPGSALLELAAFTIFYRSVRRHRPSNPEHRSETWMLIVFAGTITFLGTMSASFATTVYLALNGDAPALPHLLDQKLIVLAVWGVLVPTIWGFNARWLPIFAGLRKSNDRSLLVAYCLSAGGIATFWAEWWTISAALLLISAVLAIDALHVWEAVEGPAKLLNVHASLPLFIRIAYIWLVVSCVLSAIAVRYDDAGGIWGASRHALTVGFVAGMVFTIGPRVLPAFCGMRILWSTRLMFWSLLLLQAGCTLRVACEPLAYEGYWTFAWKLLPYSAITELAAVILFALNIFATLLQPPAHMRRLPRNGSLQGRCT